MGFISCFKKGESTFEVIQSFTQRFPSWFPQNMWKEIFRYYLHFPEEYTDIYESRHLAKILLAFLFFRKILSGSESERQILFKFFRYQVKVPFGVKKGIGMAVASLQLPDDKNINEKQIFSALQTTLPEICLCRKGFFSFQENKIRFFYFEIEKHNTNAFSKKDFITLRKTLPLSLSTNLNLYQEPFCKSHKIELKKQQILRIPCVELPQFLDPHLGIDRSSRLLQRAVFEGLVTFHPDGSVQPAGAETIEVSQDSTCYLFHLRKTYWTNGEKVSAYDYEWAWKKALSPHCDCLLVNHFFPIANAKKVNSRKAPVDALGVKAVDERTLAVTLEYPCPYFLGLLTNPVFSPIWKGKDKTLDFVSNGPFRINNWEPFRTIRLVPNQHYWDAEKVRLERIDLFQVPDSEEAFKRFEKKELDCLGAPFTSFSKKIYLSPPPQSKMEKRSLTGAFWLYCNTASFPLTNVKIRKALCVALNRKRLIQTVYHYKIPSCSLIPHETRLLNESELPPDNDPKMALALFQEGLHELHLSPEFLHPIRLSHSFLKEHSEVALELKKQWEDILPIKVNLEGYSWTKFTGNLRKGNYQIGGASMFTTCNDPYSFLEFFRSTTHCYNVTNWEHPLYQSLLDNALKDSRYRLVYLRAAERFLMDEMPIIPLFLDQGACLFQEDIQGIYLLHNGGVDFKWAYRT